MSARITKEYLSNELILMTEAGMLIEAEKYKLRLLYAQLKTITIMISQKLLVTEEQKKYFMFKLMLKYNELNKLFSNVLPMFAIIYQSLENKYYSRGYAVKGTTYPDPLLCACHYNLDIFVKELVIAGHNIEVEHINGSTPIMFSAENFNTKMIEFLIAHGAKSSYTSKLTNSEHSILVYLNESWYKYIEKLLKNSVKKIEII
jgi:hypothetical protein